jgi:NitT/TauT family transport system permease protein
MKIEQKKYKNIAYPIGTLIILIFIWYFAVILFDIKTYILPNPFAIPKNFIDNFSLLMYHMKITLFETLAGFLLSIVIGVFISILIASSDTLDKMISPYIILSQSFPKTAIAPLMIIWFGYGILPKIIMSFLIGFFPITMNMVMGLKSPDVDLLDLLKSMSATKKQIFLKVRIPASIPYFFNGVKISIPMCLVGAVVGEFVGANRGIGYLIMMANNELNTVLVFSGLIALMIIGALLYFFAEKVEKKLAPWYSMRRK